MTMLENQKNAQSGQALVEYVLLLAIGVSLILGFAYQFYKPFGSWVENQMGPYLECLLDVGELPGLGSDSASECASVYQPFPGSKEAAQAAALRREQDKERAAKAKKSRSSGGGSDDAGTGGNSMSAASSGSGGRYGRGKGFATGGPSGADSPSASGNETMVEKLPESKFLKLRSNSSFYQQRQSSRAQGLAGIVPYEREQEKLERGGRVSAGRIEEDFTVTGKPKRLIVKAAERKVAEDEVHVGFSFGNYIKYAVIIMIIIALVLFIAGQASQISKSMEK